MMDSQRSSDFQATERIFRKVIHPGLDSLRLVDKNGIPINAPLNSMKQKMFILSPRGVPTRVTNHAYSGQPMRMSRPYSEGLRRIEVPDYYNENNYEYSSYGTPQSITPYSSKRNTSNFSRGNRQMVKSKSASCRPGYLSSVADEKRYLQSAKSSQSSRWNNSSQGLRLEKEWTDLATSRSLKRNSEIVTHRVDRMYFMTGNSISIKPKYQVDEDELNHLRELSKSRQSSRRQSRPAQCLETCMEEESMCKQSCETEEIEIIAQDMDLNFGDPYVNVSRRHNIQSVVLNRAENYTRIQSARTPHIATTVVGHTKDGMENGAVTSQKSRSCISVGRSRSKAVKRPLGHVIYESVIIDSEDRNVQSGSLKNAKNSTDEARTPDLMDTVHTLSKLWSPDLSFVSKNVTEDKVSQNPVKPASRNNNGGNDEKLNFPHWNVDFDSVSVADILNYGKSGTSDDSVATRLKNLYNGVKKSRIGIKTDAELQATREKRSTKKQTRACRNKENRPCVGMASVRTYAVEKPSRNFSNKKTKPTRHRPLHLQPVDCGCRENTGNLHNNLCIEGTSAPLYKSANTTVDGEILITCRNETTAK